MLIFTRTIEKLRSFRGPKFWTLQAHYSSLQRVCTLSSENQAKKGRRGKIFHPTFPFLSLEGLKKAEKEVSERKLAKILKLGGSRIFLTSKEPRLFVFLALPPFIFLSGEIEEVETV